ncbi:MAG: hypothetical protein H0X27_07780 [Caulobacteraceae bacterium]|nr:hypothetical protein [Caulobacteraceae bacterium]
MPARPVPQPNWAWPIEDGSGLASRWFRDLVQALYERVGGQSDKVDAAHALGTGAVARGMQVIAAGGLQVGGALGGNVGLAFYRAVDAVAALPTAGLAPGDWAYALNGRKNGEGTGAGTGVPVFWDGAAWKAVDTGATVAA